MENKTIHSPGKVNWSSVIIFYLIACAFSWPFFWMRDMEPEAWNAWRIPGVLKTWTYMWGPGIAAIICLVLFKKSHPKTIGFFGNSVLKSLLFYFIPLAALCIPGVEGQGMNAHLFPLAFSIIGFITILGEELGWRGFLQDALRPLPPAKRYILLGIMWELWHFTNRTHHRGILQAVTLVAMFAVVTVILSFLIGTAADKSKSLVVAVTLHAWVDILFEFQGLGTWIVFACCIPFWIWMLLKWNKEEAVQPATETFSIEETK